MQEKNQQELEQLEELRKKKLPLYNAIKLLFVPLFLFMAVYLIAPYIHTSSTFLIILALIACLIVPSFLLNYFFLTPISNRYAADFKPKILKAFAQELYPGLVYQFREGLYTNLITQDDLYIHTPTTVEEQSFTFDNKGNYKFSFSEIKQKKPSATIPGAELLFSFTFKKKLFPNLQIISNKSLEDQRALKPFLATQQILPATQSDQKYTVYHSATGLDKEVLLHFEPLLVFLKKKRHSKFRFHLDGDNFFIGLEEYFSFFSDIELEESLVEDGKLKSKIRTDLEECQQIVDLSLIALGKIANQTFGEAHRDKQPTDKEIANDDLYDHFIDS